MIEKQGIDISRWNGIIDFKAVKASGISFVIMRAGGSNGGFYKDPMFETNYKCAKTVGLNVGAYYDTGKDFISYSEGYRCAEHFLTLLKGKSFEYPVYADIETVATVHRSGATDAAISFCSRLEQKGAFAGIYASDISGFKDRLQLDRLQDRFTLWAARYGKRPNYVRVYDIWQKSSTGCIEGIDGPVDIDMCTKNFPTIIKKKKLNDFTEVS